MVRTELHHRERILFVRENFNFGAFTWTVFALISLSMLTLLFNIEGAHFQIVSKFVGASKGYVKPSLTNISSPALPATSDTADLKEMEKVLTPNNASYPSSPDEGKGNSTLSSHAAVHQPATSVRRSEVAMHSSHHNPSSDNFPASSGATEVKNTSSHMTVHRQPTTVIGSEKAKAKLNSTHNNLSRKASPDSSSAEDDKNSTLRQSTTVLRANKTAQAHTPHHKSLSSRTNVVPRAIRESSTTALSCRRTCRHYNNKILLSQPNLAGWSDRMTVIYGTAQLAGYLCARVYIARPKFWLSPIHNRGREVDVHMKWGDIKTFHFLDDVANMSVLADWTNEADLNAHPKAYKITRSRKYQKWFHLRTINETQIGDHLERIEALSFSQKKMQASDGFIWEILAGYYLWMDSLMKHLRQRQRPSSFSGNSSDSLPWRSDMQPFVGVWPASTGCQYATKNASTQIQEIVQQIFDEVQQNASRLMLPGKDYISTNRSLPPWIGYFHVRRGDTIKVCNTSLERLERYISCSLTEPLRLASTASNYPRHLTVLFSSDEMDVEYRQSVARLVLQHNLSKTEGIHQMVNNKSVLQQLQQIQTITVSFVDLDALGRDHIAKAVQEGKLPRGLLNNNFYLFGIISSIQLGRPAIIFHLAQRQFMCPQCTNLTGLFLERQSKDVDLLLAQTARHHI